LDEFPFILLILSKTGSTESRPTDLLRYRFGRLDGFAAAALIDWKYPKSR
jgi:hypothetical protein